MVLLLSLSAALTQETSSLPLFFPGSCADAGWVAASSNPPASTPTATSLLMRMCSALDELDDEPDEGQRLGERDPQEHRGPGDAGRLRLPGHGLDGVAHDEADADAGADGGESVRHRPEAVLQLVGLDGRHDVQCR